MGQDARRKVGMSQEYSTRAFVESDPFAFGVDDPYEPAMDESVAAASVFIKSSPWDVAPGEKPFDPLAPKNRYLNAEFSPASDETWYLARYKYNVTRNLIAALRDANGDQ